MSLILLQLKIFSENSETSFLILVIPFHLETFFVSFYFDFRLSVCTEEGS